MRRDTYARTHGAPTLLPWCTSDGTELRALILLLGERYALPLQQLARAFYPKNVHNHCAIATYGQIAFDTGLPFGRVRHALRELSGRSSHTLPFPQFLHVEFFRKHGGTVPHWYIEYRVLQEHYLHARQNGKGEQLVKWEYEEICNSVSLDRLHRQN